MTASHGNPILESAVYCSQAASSTWVVDQTAEGTLERPVDEDAGT